MTSELIIGISGKAEHGKDTLADAINGELFQFARLTRRNFADSLKEDAYEFLVHNLRHEGAWLYRWLEDSLDGPMTPLDFINSIKHIPQVRSFLQHYGQAQRAGNPDYWIHRLMEWLKMHKAAMARLTYQTQPPIHYNGLIISDVRYPNEAEHIRALGGMVLRVERFNEDGTPYENRLSPEARAHDSETALDDYPHFAYHIRNVSGFKIDVPTEVLDYATSQPRADPTRA